MCQKGGWQSLQGTDGTRFDNQDECVSYGAHGGTLESIPLGPNIHLEPREEPCQWIFTASGFTPHTTYRIVFYVDGVATSEGTDFTMDEDGDLDFFGVGLGQPGPASVQARIFALTDLVNPLAESNVVSC